MKVPDEIKRLYLKQGYRFAGEHSACKICLWTKKSLRNKGFCYKEKFYGIHANRCLQMTPSLFFCTHKCLWCWRYIELTSRNIRQMKDKPKDILDNCILAQRELLTGFKDSKQKPSKKWKEAQNPKHVAISLAGEPTMYPFLSRLIKEAHKRKMTTFLVTNGTFPEKIKNLNPLPTQLYLTLPAPNKSIYKKSCRPLIKDGWERINKTLKLYPSLNTRKVIRLTLVKGLNFKNPKEYARLIKKANPHFLEVKAFVSVGFARKRLAYERMLLHNEIKSFSKKLAKELNWKIIDEKADSRVVLLAEKDYKWRKLTLQ